MHARVTRVSVFPDKIDEATELFRSAVVPAAQKQPGFHGLRLLTDRSSGASLAISLWESEEAMQAGEASGYLKAQYARFGALFSTPPTAEHYEVSVAE